MGCRGGMVRGGGCYVTLAVSQASIHSLYTSTASDRSGKKQTMSKLTLYETGSYLQLMGV